MRILLVDDEMVALTSIRRILRRRGIRHVEICNSGKAAIRKIKESHFDMVLLDLIMPDTDGLKVLQETKPFNPHTEFLILTAIDDISSAVKAVRMGAYDYLVKPVENERLFLAIERAYERSSLLAGIVGSPRFGGNELQVPEPFSRIVTQCPRMMELLNYAKVMAKNRKPFLITGETGTGKELVARGIYKAGLYPDGPFVAVNAASIPETLFESQIFGHVKGAFTGTEGDYAGLFEQANSGTLFLDEIGELPLRLQAKLLRVLDESTVTRLGSTKPIRLNVRVVSATNSDLDKAMEEKRFRLDLLCRLKSVHIHLPPLRERDGDIPLLANHFLKSTCIGQDKQVDGFSPESMNLLCTRNYSGNIRSLKQLIENAVMMTDTNLILPHHLTLKIVPTDAKARSMSTLKEDQKKHVAFVLSNVRGDRKAAAKILGISIRQIQRKLAEMKKDSRW